MGTKSKGRTPEAQKELDGILPAIVKIPALTRACKALLGARAEYQKAGMDAKEAGDRVRALMHEHEDKLKDEAGNLYYRFAGGSIELKQGKEAIKIVMGDSEPEGELLGNED
jgi:hypothetical protein